MPPVKMLSLSDNNPCVNRAIAVRRRNKKSLKEHLNIICFTSKTCSFILVCIVFVLKLTMTVLYVIRAAFDDVDTCTYCGNSSNLNENEINWRAIIWIQKPMPIWATEIAISIYTQGRMFIVTYLRFKGSWVKIITLNLTVETCMSMPFIITIFCEKLRNLYLPSFINCWLAKRMLDQNILSHRKMKSVSLFTQKVVAVFTTILCLIFSGVCAVQHLQRGSATNLGLFESFYFVMVTLSTVGYGDISPDIWPSQLFVIALIIIALVILPKQFESLASTWLERQKLGGTYGSNKRGEVKHVVVSSNFLSDEVIDDFLLEFYSHRQLQDYYAVFMSPSELEPSARRIIMSPLWLHKTMFIKGSCLKEADLERAGLKQASAFFLLGDVRQTDKSIADEHTILRAWAVKDFASKLRQFVQIFRPENKVHVKFSKFTVCEDEFKYAMLAYNCLIPGTSTLLTLLLHTSKGEEGQLCKEKWLKLYGKCSGNEIYAIRLSESYIFGQYENSNFTYAALCAHKRYGVILIGVQSTPSTESLLLNPGASYILRATDLCIYLSIFKEEDMNFDLFCSTENISSVHPRETQVSVTDDDDAKQRFVHNYFNEALDLSSELSDEFRPISNNSSLPTLDEYRNKNSGNDRWITDNERCQLHIGRLPIVPYIGIPKTLCHLRKDKKPICCLRLDQICKHCQFNTVKQYAWANHVIIVAVAKANNGLYNFIIPLRAYYHHRKHLKPIIFLLEEEPESYFLDALAWFPLVYWMKGSISNLDDLLAAGINYADNVVIVSNEGKLGNSNEDDLADSDTIVNVQKLKRYFPHVNFITELLQASNMRFMHFQANDECAVFLSEVEKLERERGSTLSFMFRMQFAAGAVFNVNMLGTMLYQGFLKDYLIPVMRRILGIIQMPASGFLTSMVVSKKEPWSKTYGSMFAFMSTTSSDIPIGIYRTENLDKNIGVEQHQLDVMNPNQSKQLSKMDEDIKEINNLVKNRLKSLGLSPEDYEHGSDHSNMISYVIINPQHDLELEDEDIIFIIRPPQRSLMSRAAKNQNMLPLQPNHDILTVKSVEEENA